MGDFSRNTFNKLNHYVSVRMQQGVPLIDADWNEQEDIRKYELRTFLKWFVGNGVPKGNDGFHIMPPANNEENDFIIKGGTEDDPGYCLVDGWDVMIEDDINYTGQPLYENESLAEKWNVKKPGPLSPPTDGERTDMVFIDVWEREVDAYEDDKLINEDIGIETCVRLKREWAVRVAENLSDEEGLKQYLQDHEIVRPGHVYYPLAFLTRTASQNVISNITDLRRTGLAVLSEEITIKDGYVGIGTIEPEVKLDVNGDIKSDNLTVIQKDVHQITTDAYGSSYTLCHYGQPELRVSLRDAINAVLRGALPATSPEALTIETSNESLPRAFKDQHGVIWVFWRSVRYGKLETWYNRRVNGTWEGQIQLTSGGYDEWAFPLEDRDGNIWVFWHSKRTGIFNIYYNRCRCIDGTWDWEGEKKLTASTTDPLGVGNLFCSALEDRNGDIWAFWQSTRNVHGDIYYNRYRCIDGTWDWEGEAQLTTSTTDNGFPFALEDRNGDIWVFWNNGQGAISYNICVDGNWQGEKQVASGIIAHLRYLPYALKDRNGNIRVFWHSNSGIRSNRFIDGEWEGETQLSKESGENIEPSALEDRHGVIWLFWRSNRNGSWDIYYNRFIDGEWEGDKQLTTEPVDILYHYAIEGNNDDIHVFWGSKRSGNEDIWYCSLVHSI